MNQDQELKIQALLDGELAEGEAREIQQLLASDQKAQALFSELQTTRSYLMANEPEMVLPESREFFWSKIQREIDRPVPAEAARAPLGLVWRRYFARFAGVAAVAMLVVFSMKFYDVSLMEGPSGHLAEIENLSEHSSSLSFRSQKENMFVVWVYNKDQQSEESDLDSLDDTIVQ
jgi:negative regulator of sigma E activity